MNITIRNIIVTSLLLFLSQVSFSQEEEVVYEDTISVTEWLDWMKNAEANSFGTAKLKDTWIRFDENGVDSILRTRVIRMELKDSSVIIKPYYDGFFDENDYDIQSFSRDDQYNYEKYQSDTFQSILLENCKLSGFYEISGFNFRYLGFENCVINSGIRWKDCSFEWFYLSETQGYYWGVENCEIGDFIDVTSCTFSSFEVFDCLFEKTRFFRVFNGNDIASIYISDNTISSVHIENNRFTIIDSNFLDLNYVPIFLMGSIENLRLTKMNLRAINCENLSVSKSVIFENMDITNDVRFRNFDFPEKNTNLDWDIIKGRKIGFITLDGEYNGKSNSQLSNKFKFKELLSIYNRILSLYRIRGDRQSFNACYVEMRDLETDRLRYDYTQNKTINTMFNWRMNQFLKTFCAFGTDPVKPLIISMWVILGFGLMYFFFYNEWDKVNRQFLIKQHRKMLQYFSSEQKLEDFYTDEYKEEFKSYEAYKKEIEETAVHVPFFIRMLGKPLYQLSLARFRMMTWLYRRTEVLQGKWSDLAQGRKVFVGITVGSGIVVYLLFLVVIRLLNSTVLSINTFSTLGFGDIPVQGVMKYMAILEGFLGWFLLSIFSVSLISQILPA